MVTYEYPVSSNEPTFAIYNESGFSIPVSGSTVNDLCLLVSRHEKCSFGLIEVVYVDQNAILGINRKYLNHDYVTDIITFPYQAYDMESLQKNGEKLDGTLYCCAQRIAEQSNEFGETIENEFQRVLIHGLLHLTGYNDKTDTEQIRMRERENFYLSAYKELHAK